MPLGESAGHVGGRGRVFNMNIYLHVETTVRELDSKLLLAVLAALRGHTVIVSDMSSIMNGVQSGTLKPGVLHTKSLTPGKEKISRHQFLIDRGFSITSIDEEGGLVDHDYDEFANIRYSEETIAQASALFGWGTEDTESLKHIYPNYSLKMYQTGSPRADLWKQRFAEYWSEPKAVPEKSYLLVSSNMGLCNGMRPFYENIKMERNGGYYQRDPDLFARRFGIVAEEYHMTHAFIEAIRHLALHSNGFDIVLRPHPVENIEAWKVYLEGIPNVHVIREGSITAWVNNAFAIMHNGCTTALEATISGKPVITYLPFEQEYAREIPNELGERVESLDDLTRVANDFFVASVSTNKNYERTNIPKSVSKKVYLDDAELASEKMVKVWESFDGDLSQPSSWRRFQWLLKAVKARSMVGSILRKAFPDKFGRPAGENYKFPPLDEKDIRDRVNRLQNVLGVDVALKCKLISERTILIRKKPL